MSAGPIGTAAAAAALAGSSSPAVGSAATGRVYRILHFTDIHFTVRPTWRECWAEPKRLLGLINHSLLGRAAHFSRHVQRQLVGEVRRHRPTHVVVSGDLTSFASDAEFELAYDTLQPILRPSAQPVPLRSQLQQQPAFSSTSQWPDSAEIADTHAARTHATNASHSRFEPPQPPSDALPPSYLASSASVPVASHRTVLVCGNHDVYTVGSVRSRLFDRWFGHWRLPTARILSVAPDLHFVAIDACQPNRVSSHGHVDEQQLSVLRASLSSPSLRSSFVVLVSHYPLLDRDGSDYGTRHPWHGIDNSSQLSAVVRESMAALLADQSSAAGSGAMLLHGHVHRGYTVPFPLAAPPPPPAQSHRAAASFPVYNPGAAGSAFRRGRRAAAYNVYTVERLDGQGDGVGDGDEAGGADVGEGGDGDRDGGGSSDSSSGSRTSGGRHVHRINGWRLAVERFVHNGDTFEKEQQGPYTTHY